MGLLNFLTGGRAKGGSFERSTPIAAAGNYSRALQATTPAAITPANPGSFATIRSAPILQAPRYFSQEEASAIRQRSSQLRRQVGSTKSAYKGLMQIEKADAAVHVAHREYETVVGKSENKKKRSDVKHAKTMIGLAPSYAGMQQSIALAADRAAAQIQASQQQRLIRHEQTKAKLQGVK